MASSLEELLAEEGFKGRRSMKSRSSLRSTATNTPSHRSHDRHNSDPSTGDRMRTDLRRSTLSRYSSSGGLPTSDKIKASHRSQREKLEEGSKQELHGYKPRKENYSFFEEEETESVKDIYSSEVNSWRSTEKEGSNNLDKHLLHSKKSMKALEYSKSFDDNQSQSKQHDQFVQSSSIPALDKAAIQALVSILTGYVKRFLREEDFRAMVRNNCFSSQNLMGREVERQEEEEEEGGGENGRNKVISNLNKAIYIVEKSAEEMGNERALKKASLLLSMITGLKDELFTNGVPNSNLSACAHLYLGIIYKLLKKDKGSAKHILQVFSDSPFQARTVLLPELWDSVFFPHLFHLKEWYDGEVDSIGVSPNSLRKLEFLEKSYNEILDYGTCQIAVYYKDWLVGGRGGGVDSSPSMPSIPIPPICLKDDFTSHTVYSGLPSPSNDSLSSQPMVSKKLYDAVFGNLRKSEDDDVALERLEDCRRSSGGSTELKHTVSEYSGNIKYTDQASEEEEVEEDSIGDSPEKGAVLKDEWKMYEVNIPLEKDMDDESICNTATIGQKIVRVFQMRPAKPRAKVNEIKLKRFAKSIFESQRHSSCLVDLSVSSPSSSSEASTSSYSLTKPIKARSSSSELNESYEYFEERSSLLCIPEDFICPLTRQLFEDPITLETGQTFEQNAIKAWFDRGNKTCPVTGKNLESLTIPLINFVLKRVIHKWKSDRCLHLLAYASQILDNWVNNKIKENDEMETAILVFEQLLSSFGKEEGVKNIKHILSFGGLSFLLRRFEAGKMEEKTRIVSVLSGFIEADARCRKQIAREINRRGLLSLLHSNQDDSITNAVLFLSKLICLKRIKDVTSFLLGLLKEEGQEDTMGILLQYLHSSQPEQRPLLAVLLLHFDVVVEYKKYSIYRGQAVDAITTALDGSLTDENIRKKCCEAILVLGGRFSFSGKLLIEIWMLKQAGYINSCEMSSLDNPEEGEALENKAQLDDEERMSEEWLRNLAGSLLNCGRKRFLETVSTCLSCGEMDLVGVCLTTVAWLSFALSTLSDSEYQLSAFSTLFSQLKRCLENGLIIEHKILASMSLLNFSKISECRVLLMTMGKEIGAPLRSISEVTWTAKQLYAIISGEDA